MAADAGESLLEQLALDGLELHALGRQGEREASAVGAPTARSTGVSHSCSASSMARSIVLRSSRTLPGQS
jgi:hypothetical protein